MKKALLLLLATISLTACRENSKNLSSQTNSHITFKGLDSINYKPKTEIEKYLQKNGYAFLNSQPKSDQWKSDKNEEIIQFNGEGVLVFLTYSNDSYNSLLADLNKSEYKSSGTSLKNNIEVESYSKDKETIFLSSLINPEDNKKVYSLTFIN